MNEGVQRLGPAMPAARRANTARRILPWLLALLLIASAASIVVTHRNQVKQMARRAFEIAPVFANGKQGYTCYRIPGIAQAPDGTLLAFAEGRRYDCNDFGDIQIVMRRSHDGGANWTPLEVVASNGHMQAGNPAPVVDTMDPRYPQGRLFLFYSTSDTPEDQLAMGHGSAHVWYRASTDAGATWGQPVEITASVKPADWGNYGTGPGHALQLDLGPHRGRIFVPGFHTQPSPKPPGVEGRAQGFYSDDHGQTWQRGATVDWPESSESSAAQAADASVVMSSREETGSSGGRIISVSTSGGERWDRSFVARNLPDPICEGSMVSYAAPGGKRVLLASNLRNRDLGYVNRHGLAVSESTDGGESWPKHKTINEGASNYSDLVVMPGGVLGILFERRDDGTVVFVTRPIAKLF